VTVPLDRSFHQFHLILLSYFVSAILLLFLSPILWSLHFSITIPSVRLFILLSNLDYLLSPQPLPYNSSLSLSLPYTPPVSSLSSQPLVSHNVLPHLFSLSFISSSPPFLSLPPCQSLACFHALYGSVSACYYLRPSSPVSFPSPLSS